MNTTSIKSTALTMVLVLGVMTQPFAAEPLPGALRVDVSLTYPDDSMLKFRPTEVQILKAEHMQKNVAGKVALGVLLFAFTGGTGFTTSSKDDMAGGKIQDVEDRSNLQITDATVFAAHVQTAVQAAMQGQPQWSDKTFKYPLTVAGGMVQLVYEGLTGDDANLYRLKADWVVYKHRESFSLFGAPNVSVDCSYQSPTPLSQAAWAENNYAQVKAEMDAMLPLCEQKVVAALPELLRN